MNCPAYSALNSGNDVGHSTDTSAVLQLKFLRNVWFIKLKLNCHHFICAPDEHFTQRGIAIVIELVPQY
jgi:hypothetical protein